MDSQSLKDLLGQSSGIGPILLHVLQDHLNADGLATRVTLTSAIDPFRQTEDPAIVVTAIHGRKSFKAVCVNNGAPGSRNEFYVKLLTGTRGSKKKMIPEYGTGNAEQVKQFFDDFLAGIESGSMNNVMNSVTTPIAVG